MPRTIRLVSLIMLLTISPITVAESLAEVELDATGLRLQAKDTSVGLALSLKTPDGRVHRLAFDKGETPSVDFASLDLIDGRYRWELTPVAPAQQGDRPGNASHAPIRLQSGSFRVASGALVASSTEPVTKDVHFLDDLIVSRSACIGPSCLNGEVFGGDTLVLKEATIRLRLQDTSSGPGFPANDWQLTINDSAAGGAERFSIDDLTSGRTPFTLEAGAPEHALFVDNAGRIGAGTSTPASDLHLVSGDTPKLRLDQTGSGGFSPVAWDIAGNETNFFISDNVAANVFPVRVRMGAPTSSLDIAGSGNVGIGTASPSAALHVQRSNGNALLRVDENASAVAQRTLMSLENNGEIVFEMINDNLSRTWRIVNDNDGFVINLLGDAGGDREFLIDGIGNVTIPAGSSYLGSDRNKKARVKSIDASEILSKVEALPLVAWSWRDEATVRHIGPMAQDFYSAFGLGKDDVTLTPTDLAGVALAAIQGLRSELDTRDAHIAALEARLSALETAGGDE